MVTWYSLKRVFQNAFALLVLILTIGCNESSDGQISSSSNSAKKINQTFEVRGVVRKISEKENKIHIEHEEIPNYMGAMTMPFSVRDKNEFELIREGDEIKFELNVTDKKSWIEKIDVVLRPKREQLSIKNKPTNSLTLEENEPLRVGDELPNYSLINQENKKIQLTSFRGRILVFTFMYTRCPIPDFCPRMSQHFREVYETLKDVNINKDWHLLSISFDPDFDTPEILKNYSKAFSPDLKKWSFVTGNTPVIDEIISRFGIIVRRPKASITDWDHNLRTVIVDPNGVIQTIYIGNLWTPETLVHDLKRTAKNYLIRN
jgi:protein SCO1/2